MLLGAKFWAELTLVPFPAVLTGVCHLQAQPPGPPLSCGTCPVLGCHPIPAADIPVMSGVGGTASTGVSNSKGG